MAVEIFMQAEGSHLVPVSAMDAEAVGNLPRRKTFTVVVKQKRSTKQQRWYWGMLGLVVKATGRWPDSDVLHTALKMQMGYFTPVEQPNGMIRFVERSTSFNAMDGLAFRTFVDGAVDIILNDILVGTPRSKFMAEIEQMTGVGLAELED